jgi:hypothetical protein
VQVDAVTHQDVRNGKSIRNAAGHTGHVTLLHERAIAIYEAQGDWLIPARVFYYEDPSH